MSDNSLQFNPHKLRKKDLIWLMTHRCKHFHNYLEHPSCFYEEKPDTEFVENIGIFDIETTGLKANWSHMLAWATKDHGTSVSHSDLITRREVRDKNDKRIIKSAVEAIKKYDRVVTWYGANFDLPYLRSRALYHGLDFPVYKALCHTDLYYVARAKLALHSNRLAVICGFFGIEAKHHPMTPELWRRAGAGESEALQTILTHCMEDVNSTDQVFDLLVGHTQIQQRSI